MTDAEILQLLIDIQGNPTDEQLAVVYRALKALQEKDTPAGK